MIIKRPTFTSAPFYRVRLFLKGCSSAGPFSASPDFVKIKTTFGISTKKVERVVLRMGSIKQIFAGSLFCLISPRFELNWKG